jgi:hypothetical protein
MNETCVFTAQTPAHFSTEGSRAGWNCCFLGKFKQCHTCARPVPVEIMSHLFYYIPIILLKLTSNLLTSLFFSFLFLQIIEKEERSVGEVVTSRSVMLIEVPRATCTDRSEAEPPGEPQPDHSERLVLLVSSVFQNLNIRQIRPRIGLIL